MLYIPKIDDYLEILTEEEVKDFVATNFSKYFKSIKEEQNLRKVAKSLYIFLTKSDKVEKYVQSNSSDNCIFHYKVEILHIFDPELQLINTKPVIKNKLKVLRSELKKFKVQKVLALDCKKRNDPQIFYSSSKLIASYSGIDEAFKYMHQSIMAKIKNYAREECIVLDAIIKHSITIFEC